MPTVQIMCQCQKKKKCFDIYTVLNGDRTGDFHILCLHCGIKSKNTNARISKETEGRVASESKVFLINSA